MLATMTFFLLQRELKVIYVHVTLCLTLVTFFSYFYVALSIENARQDIP
jgi:hypothetical protein